MKNTDSRRKLVMAGMIRNSTNWIRNIARKTQRRVIVSESQAQNSRPAPLKIEMRMTMLLAVVASTPVISWAIGAACEMTMTPAVTFRKSMAHSTYHCQVRNDSCNVKSLPARWLTWTAEGVQPGGV